MNASASVASAEPSSGADLVVLDDPDELQRFTRWVDVGQGHKQAESSFQLGGMYCAACAGLIENALHGVPGVVEAQVSSAAQRARVRWDPTQTKASALVQAVRRAGYDAVPDAAAPAREMRRKERRTALWRVFVASFCAMQVMMFATPSYVAGPGELAPDLRQLLNWGSWLVALPTLVFSAGPFLRGAWLNLKTRQIGMDVPVALGILVTFIASTGATFDPDGVFGHEVYFDSFTMFISFLLVGRFLEMSARHRAAESLEKALAGMPETAVRLLDDGSAETVSIHRLRQGDRVQVALGAAFPADGRLELGRTEADESLLTGESHPVAKAPGDEVVGGSINLGATAIFRVERVGADTRYEAIVAMMRDALTQRPALARRADTWAKPFLWGVLVLAVGAAVVWSWIDPGRAVWVAVSVLIVTCPCALSLAAPSALVAAAGAMAKRGVMLQRLDAIEALASMTRLFMDKTGTLTDDKPVWVRTTVLHPQPHPDWETHARALARGSNHPLSRALASSAASLPSQTASPWLAVEETPGAGLQAQDAQGMWWRLGSQAWVEQDSPAPTLGTDQTAVWFGPVGQAAVLRFEFDEQLRADVAPALAQLQADGVRLTLLSGDAPARVAQLGQRLGLSDLQGGAQPQDKLAAVAKAQAAGEVVGMVGDGVNDAPVLARANVSFAMGQGALVSRVHADAVIMSNRLEDLSWARVLSQRSVAIVRQNLVWAALYNTACIPLALLGYLPPWAAGLGMATSSLLVVGNSLRLSR